MEDFLLEDRLILSEERQREYGWDFEKDELASEKHWFDRLDYLPAQPDDDDLTDTTCDFGV